MLPKKKMEFKDTRQNISVPFAVSTNVNLKNPNFEKKTKKIIHGSMLGQDRPEKHSVKCLIRSGEIPSR